jgi:hypothetical protein
VTLIEGLSLVSIDDSHIDSSLSTIAFTSLSQRIQAFKQEMTSLTSHTSPRVQEIAVSAIGSIDVLSAELKAMEASEVDDGQAVAPHEVLVKR